jgi:general secretion pathway protein K
MGVEQDEILDSILDWKDRDHEHRMNGAEDDYYNSLPDPYDCKDGNFDTIEELLLIKGITPELFYGSGALDKPQGALSGISALGLKDLLTTYSYEVNKNTAPEEVLYATLSEGEANRILNQRDQTPFQGTQGQSKYFTIISQGTVDNSNVVHTIKATVSKLGDTVKIKYWHDNYVEFY